MTFLPRITPAGGSAAEPSQGGHGHAHAAWGHVPASGAGATSEALEAAPASSHEPLHAEQLEEEVASADAPEVAHASATKTANGKRAARTRPDEPSPGFAAELAKNVLAGTDGETHADLFPEAAGLDHEETSAMPPPDAHTAMAGGLFQRLAGAPDGHASHHVGEGLPAEAPKKLPGAPDDGPPAQAAPGDLPREVVNGSSETPKSDAMSVSPRVSTGSHARADGGENPRAVGSEHAVSARGPGAPVLLATGHDGAGEPAFNATPASEATSNDLLEGDASAMGRAAGARVGVPTGGHQQETSLESGLQSPAQPHPGSEAQSLPSLTAPSQLAQAASSSLIGTETASVSVPRAGGVARPEAGQATIPSARPVSVTDSHSRGAASASIAARWPQPLPAPVGPGPVAAPAAGTMPASFGVKSIPATGASMARSDEPPRATPAVRPTPSRSVARAGAAYTQIATDGEPAPRPLRDRPATSSPPVFTPAAASSSPAPAPLRSPPATALPVSADGGTPARSPASKARSEGDVAPVQRRKGAVGADRAQGPDATPLSPAVQSPAIALQAPTTSAPAAAVPAPRSQRDEGSPVHVAPRLGTPADEAVPADRPAVPSAHAAPTTPGAPSTPSTPSTPSPTKPRQAMGPEAPSDAAAELATAAPPSPFVNAPHAATSSPPPVPGARSRRDVADAPVQASARPAAPPISPLAVPSQGAPHAAMPTVPAPQSAPSLPPSLPQSLPPSSPVAPSIPTGGGVTATGESTAAHPTPLVDPSPATPPLFRLSDTRRVQAAHLDLAQQSYQSGTVATSSPSTKGFDTGPDGDKTDKAKKVRAANFAPVSIAGSSTPAVSVPPNAASGDDRPVRRPAATSARSAREEQPADAIHALTSAGSAAPLVAASLTAPAPPAPAVHHAAPKAGRADLSPSRDVTASAAAPGEVTDVDRDAKRSAATPAADARLERREPAPVTTADKAPAPVVTGTQAPSPSALQTPAAPAAGPQAPLAAQPLYDLATADHSLQATALGNNAHLHLDAGAAGALSLHLSVRDGVADVEVEGPAAERLNFRPEELRRALAGEGLALGHFVSRANEASDTRSQQDDGSSRNQGGQSGADRGTNTPDAPRPTATPFAAQSGASSYGGESRRQWQGETPDSADRDRRPGAPPANGTPTTTGDATPARRRGVHVTA